MLFHHSPERTDEQLDELCRRLEVSPGVRAATQGEVIAVRSPAGAHFALAK